MELPPVPDLPRRAKAESIHSLTSGNTDSRSEGRRSGANRKEMEIGVSRLEGLIVPFFSGQLKSKSRLGKLAVVEIADNSVDISDRFRVWRHTVKLLDTRRTSIVSRQGLGQVLVVLDQQIPQVASSTIYIGSCIQRVSNT